LVLAACLNLATTPVCGAGSPSEAATPTTSDVDEIVVVGRAEDLIGTATAPSDGTIGSTDLQKRPILRPTEVLEAVPGVIVTQHSGSGKANQFFLRGFNLDHGTDFSTFIDGVPFNLPTHAHGQGYLDLNLLTPELVDRVDYQKGPYHQETGDFSSAGSARIAIKRSLEKPILQVTAGGHKYSRFLMAQSEDLGKDRTLLWAVEANGYSGPWVTPEALERVVGLVKFTQGTQERGYSLTLIGYHNDWTSTDQIPRRAVAAGLISPFETIDPTSGGNTARGVLAAQGWIEEKGVRTDATAWMQRYQLDLFSNFTYFLDDPVNGDQFQQADRRTVYGSSVRRRWSSQFLKMTLDSDAGLQLRYDNIGTVALRKTRARSYISSTREDSVKEGNAGIYYQDTLHVNSKWRFMTGVRANTFQFDVKSVIPENSGNVRAGIVDHSYGTAYQISPHLELYALDGSKFHSNDARGTTIKIDPTDTTLPADSVPALVRTHGREVGLRAEPVAGLKTTLTAWELDLASELLFVGDAGNTEASRPSHRKGIELTNFYKYRDWFTFYFDYSLSRARFKDLDPTGDQIPGSIETVISSGLTFERPGGLFGSLGFRFFGGRPLIEDDSARSGPTRIVNLQLGRHQKPFTWTVDVLNLFDSHDDDITYFYTSRLMGEPGAGVPDYHFHPVIPREVRVTLRKTF
jgi:outer membrane cobalamin receptor